MECNFGNIIVSLPQPWNWLENRRSKDDKISKEVWKTVKTEARKTKVVKAKRGRKEREGEEKRGKQKEETKRRKNNRGKKN